MKKNNSNKKLTLIKHERTMLNNMIYRAELIITIILSANTYA